MIAVKPLCMPAAILTGAFVLSCSDGTGPSSDPLTITTESLKDAVAGEPYTTGVDAEGGDGEYTWEVVAGALPPELVLSPETAPVNGGNDPDLLITGTPGEEGTYTFTLEVRSGDGQSAEREFSIEVHPGGVALAIQNVGLPPALAGAAYSVVLRAVGGPSVDYEWELVSGTLPAGLELSNGRIRGTPGGADTTQVTIRATSGSESVTRTFVLQVVANRTQSYEITTFPVVAVPGFVRPHLEAAVARWQEVITGDLQAIAFPEGSFTARACDGFGQDLNGTAVDDLILLVNITEIDGVGRVLGRAGACVIRNSNKLPAVGILTLDADDLADLADDDSRIVEYLLTHEIGHVLGIGGLWRELDLVQGAGGSNPRFTGQRAVAEWQALGGEGAVPLETEGGTGTAEVHWRESVFNTELMTGFVEGPGVLQPLSRVSIASLADLGYAVDLSAADPFSLASALRAEGALPPHTGYDELYTGPVWVVESGPDPVIRPR